ncbi:MAG: hypothetical protein ACX94C_03045 [Phycisphaerales bacterium]
MTKQQRAVPISTASMGLALLLCSGTMLSCASQGDRESVQLRATADIGDPVRALEARAELETLRPLKRVDESIIRRVLEDTTDALTPGTEAYRRALLSADEIPLEPIRALGSPFAGAEDVDPLRKGHAAKLYTRARTLKQTGQLDQAVQGLRRAIELDPGSHKLHTTLGDTLAEMGDSVGANESYTRALELGDRSASTLVSIATTAYALNDHERVMALCSLALAEDQPDDRVAQTLAGIMLGNAQIRQGYLRAGAESLERALTSFSPGLRNARWRQQIIQIQGRRPALWVVVGDAWSRIGSHARAAEAYAAAAELSNGRSSGLTSRRIAELLREGKPASGALLLIDHLMMHAHDLSPQEGEWVAALTELPSLRGSLNDAIASVRGQLDPRHTQARRAMMGLEIRGLSAQASLDRLASTGADARNAEAIARVLIALEDLDAQSDWALELVRRNPRSTQGVADAMLMLPHAPSEVIGMVGDRGVEGSLLGATLALQLGRADLTPEHPIESLDQKPIQWVQTMTQSHALRGSWEDARVLGAELERRAALGERDAVRSLANASISLQRPSDALAYAATLTESDEADTDDLILHARIATALNAHQTARDVLERGAQIDPSDTRIADRLIRLLGAGGPLEDEEALRGVMRRVSETAPRSELFAMLRASDLARSGLLSEAESLLVQRNEQRLGDIIGDDLLMSIWKTQETQGDEDALARGEGWLSVRLVEFPNSIRAGLALAQAHYEREQIDDATGILESLWMHTGAFEAARAYEQLLSESGNDSESLAHARGRLEGVEGIDTSIELAQVLARTGDGADAAEAADVLERNIPADVSLIPSQEQQLAQVVYGLAEYADNAGIDPAMLRVVDLIEERTGPLSFFMARTKLLLKSREARIDIDEIIALVEKHTSEIENPQQVRQLEALPIQVLLGEDRGHEAIALVTRMGINGGELREDLVIETFRLLGVVGENSDLLGVLEALYDAGVMQEVIDLTTARIGTPERPIDDLEPDEQRADLAYTAGAMAAAFERSDQSESYMRIAISFDEDHGWSNNDLGYLLVERGEKIDEAAKMLETAARVLSNQSNVIDSLGWLRYKQGIFLDEVDEMSGQVMREGAVTLLERANRLDTSRANATILLHLGDALWRAGRKQGAIDAWVAGENMTRSRMRVLNAQPPASRNQRAIDALGEELRTLRYRVQDAEAGGDPDVAPIFGEAGDN